MAHYIRISEKDQTALRFRLGARVECNCGVWKAGTIVKLFYSQRSFPEGMCVPYQVKLDEDKMIFAPDDVDHFIRQLVDDTQNRNEQRERSTTKESPRSQSEDRRYNPYELSMPPTGGPYPTLRFGLGARVMVKGDGS